MSSIDISQAIPKRLFVSQGDWCLEVQRWHALDRDLFNPMSSFVMGAEQAFQFLSDICQDPNILSQARDIVASPGAPGTCYELEGGTWAIQTSLVETASRPPEDGSAMEEVTKLQSAMGAMEERIAFLERQLSGRIPGNDAQPSVRPLSNEETPQSNAG